MCLCVCLCVSVCVCVCLCICLSTGYKIRLEQITHSHSIILWQLESGTAKPFKLKAHSDLVLGVKLIDNNQHVLARLVCHLPSCWRATLPSIHFLLLHRSCFRIQEIKQLSSGS